jgi:hypothetical protein
VGHDVLTAGTLEGRPDEIWRCSQPHFKMLIGCGISGANDCPPILYMPSKISLGRYTHVSRSISHIFSYRLICLKADKTGRRSVSSLFNRLVETNSASFCVQSAKLSCPNALLTRREQRISGHCSENASNSRPF